MTRLARLLRQAARGLTTAGGIRAVAASLHPARRGLSSCPGHNLAIRIPLHAMRVSMSAAATRPAAATSQDGSGDG
jgi:hypothetical protein